MHGPKTSIYFLLRKFSTAAVVTSAVYPLSKIILRYCLAEPKCLPSL